MKQPDQMENSRAIGLILICTILSACSTERAQEACVFPEPPSEDLLRGRLQHLELVDAETGEVATYDATGSPVLEGGQPLALWAEFNPATSVELCVLEVDGSKRVIHHSQVTFSEDVDTMPLGIYDLGRYKLYLSIGGNLAATLDFRVH